MVRDALLPRDRAAIISLWRGNLGDLRLAESKLEWFYEQSPTGQPLVLLLYYQAASTAPHELVGVATAGARFFDLAGQRIRGGVLVDLTVSPAHRTLFPALMLQKGLRERALRAMQFIYGFPNPKAKPVFQRVGYQQIAMMRRYVRVLRTGRYLARTIPDFPARAMGYLIDVADAATSRVRWHSNATLNWRAMTDANVSEHGANAGPAMLRGARTDQFLRWRFTEARGRTYSFIEVATVAKERIGYWVAENNGDTLFIRDCDVALLYSPLAQSAWNALFAAARARGLSSVSFSCVAPQKFVAMLERLRMKPRSERPVFYTSASGDTVLAKPHEIFLTDADEDE